MRSPKHASYQTGNSAGKAVMGSPASQEAANRELYLALVVYDVEVAAVRPQEEHQWKITLGSRHTRGAEDRL